MKTPALVAVLASLPVALGHSWVERLDVLNQKGQYTGAEGYPRGYVHRGPSFSDPQEQWQLPAGGGPAVPNSAFMCKETQRTMNQTQDSPRLQASPGAWVALRYQENGHVTQPWINPGKPPNRGTVSIYGTSQPSTDEKFNDVFNQWNDAGTGGNKRGKLLAQQNFDDGQCYQTSSSNISTARQKQFGHAAMKDMGTDLWCQNNIALPKDVPAGKPYTIYWVWDWNTAKGSPGAPDGKKEFYTSCMDVDITGKPPSAKMARSSTIRRGLGFIKSLFKRDIGNSGVPALIKGLTDGNANSAPGASSAPAPAPSPSPTSAPSPSSSSSSSSTASTTTQLPGYGGRGGPEPSPLRSPSPMVSAPPPDTEIGGAPIRPAPTDAPAPESKEIPDLPPAASSGAKKAIKELSSSTVDLSPPPATSKAPAPANSKAPPPAASSKPAPPPPASSKSAPPPPPSSKTPPPPAPSSDKNCGSPPKPSTVTITHTAPPPVTTTVTLTTTHEATTTVRS